MKKKRKKLTNFKLTVKSVIKQENWIGNLTYFNSKERKIECIGDEKTWVKKQKHL